MSGRRRKDFSALPIACWMALLCLGWSGDAPTQTDGFDDPATAPIPDIGSAALDPRRALIVDLAFTTGGVSATGVSVSQTPPGAMDDEPPLLLARARDAEGRRIYSLNAWDPRFVYEKLADGSEQVVLVEQSDGGFKLPFIRETASIEFLDQRFDPPAFLLSVDVTAVIADFCNVDPANINCIPEFVFISGFE